MGLDGGVFGYVQFLGNPAIAVGIGLLFAIYGLYGYASRRNALDTMEEGLNSAGIILVVTGAGGALGNVLRESGAGDYLGELIAGTGLPAILLPFVIASIVRLIQGSGTVAMITGASISAPIVTGLDVNLVLGSTGRLPRRTGVLLLQRQPLLGNKPLARHQGRKGADTRVVRPNHHYMGGRLCRVADRQRPIRIALLDGEQV